MNATERILIKVTSGQWLLTIACAGTFAYCACQSLIPAEATTAILGMVFTSYFRRERTNGHTQQPTT